MIELNQIYNMDCLKGFKEFEEKTVDLLIADPPYNLQGRARTYDNTGVKKNKALKTNDWDTYTLEDYVDFSEKWILEGKRVLKDSGIMCIFGSYHNIGIMNYLCQKNELILTSEIVLCKTNAMPNVTCSALTASHETALVVTKSKKHTFNYEWSKQYYDGYDPYLKENKQMRDFWITKILSQKESLKQHGTQKPKEWIYRLINLYSNEGDIVLDPFLGSGTTAVVAKELNRKYTGFEIDNDYFKLAEDRLKNAS